MKKRYSYIWFLPALVLASQQQALASHVVGAEISYKCTATPGMFEVTLILYRNCDGGADLCSGGCGASCTQALSVHGADPDCSTSTFGSVSLSLVNVRDAGINPECSIAKNTCTNMGCVAPGSYTPGIERYEFKGLANIGATSGIPASCCNVRFSWELCCRSGQIATGSAGANFYIDAVINRCLSVTPCNSSPELDEMPFALCSGTSAIINAGGFDPDLDSLSFAFAPALQGLNNSVSYTAPWAFDKPLPWTGASSGQFPAGINCDPLTGDIMFTPPAHLSDDFLGVVVVEITQWKKINGVPTRIGITRRDQIMHILGNCPPNKVPVLKTTPATPDNTIKTAWEVCAGQQLCFDIVAGDSDFTPPSVSDTTYLSWDGPMQNHEATFLPTYNIADRHKPAPLGGPREDSYRFCWTPDSTLVSSLPYYFTVTAKDGRCPNPGKTNRTFSVKVIGPVDIDITKTGDTCGKWLLGYTNHHPLQNLSGTWEVANDTGDYTFANGSYPRPVNAGATPVYFTKKGKYFVKLRIAQQQDEALCGEAIYTDTLDVQSVTSLNGSYIQTNTSCYGLHNGELTITATAGVTPYLYRISGHLYSNTINTFSDLGAGIYTAWVKDAMGCESIDTVKIMQPDRILTSAIAGNRTAERGTTHTYTIATQPGVSLFWSTTGTIISGQSTSSLTVKWETEGIHTLQLAATDGPCSDSATINIQVKTPTGLNELARQWALEVYPNPVKNELTISLDKLPEHCTIELYDMQGKKIIEQPLKTRQQVDVTDLNKGIYILKIGDWRGQVIKQ